MPVSESVFRFGMVLAISLLVTVSGLASTHFLSLSHWTILIGLLVAISAVLIWSPTTRA